MDEAEPPSVPEVPEVPEEPSEAVVIKKRGRPKGSLNKKTIEKMIAVAREPSPAWSGAPNEMPPPPELTLDVDFTS